MAKSTMTSKGQTTVPAEVRAALDAEPGTRLEWHVTPDGDVIVRAKILSGVCSVGISFAVFTAPAPMTAAGAISTTC